MLVDVSREVLAFIEFKTMMMMETRRDDDETSEEWEKLVVSHLTHWVEQEWTFRDSSSCGAGVELKSLW